MFKLKDENMEKIGIVDHGKTTLEELLKKDTKYVVSFFQREYSWTQDDWSDLLYDINKCLNSGSDHFFGFMALRKRDDYISIIEGQQRFATITIIISLIRDILKEKNNEKWKDIERSYIKSVDELSEDSLTTYKLELSEVNKTFFKDFIQEDGIPSKKIELFNRSLDLSNKLIYDCYKYYYNELIQLDSIKPLLQFCSIVLRKFILFQIGVQDELSAYNIFQTLNDRGLDLALADLLKVHLFTMYGKVNWKEAKVRWDEIRGILSQIKTNTFLRHYWLSKYKVVKENELLREFQKELNSKTKASSFLKNLKIEAENYEAIINPTFDYWGDQKIVDLLSNLKTLSAKMPLPVLMAYSKNPEDFKKFLMILISFVVRYVTIGDRDNKVLEKLLSDIAIGIRNGSIITISKFSKKLKSEYVDDETFMQEFSTARVKVVKVAKYLLQEIENHIGGKQEKYDKTINVEHFLPKKPNEDWQEYIKDNKIDKDLFVDRIGNLTLLLGKTNQKLRNEFFTIKKQRLFNNGNTTKLKINEWFKNIQSWTHIDIEERQKWLAKQAVEIWKFN